MFYRLIIILHRLYTFSVKNKLIECMHAFKVSCSLLLRTSFDVNVNGSDLIALWIQCRVHEYFLRIRRNDWSQSHQGSVNQPSEWIDLFHDLYDNLRQFINDSDSDLKVFAWWPWRGQCQMVYMLEVLRKRIRRNRFAPYFCLSTLHELCMSHNRETGKSPWWRNSIPVTWCKCYTWSGLVSTRLYCGILPTNMFVGRHERNKVWERD